MMTVMPLPAARPGVPMKFPSLAGDWLLTPQRAAVLGDTAVVADLHLGYGRVRRRGGEAVPVPTVAEELEGLAACVREYGVRRVVVAGDLFEDGRHERGPMEGELLAWAAEYGVALTVVPGNHDRGLAGSRLDVVAEAEVGGWRVVHGDGALPAGRVVQGHEHPWLRWRPGVEGPCFLVAEGHLVLPAYSADAAGGNVRGVGRWRNHRACVIAGAEVLDFGEVGRLG